MSHLGVTLTAAVSIVQALELAFGLGVHRLVLVLLEPLLVFPAVIAPAGTLTFLRPSSATPFLETTSLLVLSLGLAAFPQFLLPTSPRLWNVS